MEWHNGPQHHLPVGLYSSLYYCTDCTRVVVGFRNVFLASFCWFACVLTFLLERGVRRALTNLKYVFININCRASTNVILNTPLLV